VKTGNPPCPFRKEEFMSEERLEQETKDDTDDVEAHRKKEAFDEATEEPGSEESDDVEAHMRRAKHKE
jgi:hypothetical protein